MNEVERLNGDDSLEWGFNDVWGGLLFLMIGLMSCAVLVGFVRNGLWELALVGGFGWMMAPILTILGANAIWQGLKAGVARLASASRR